MNRTTRLRFWLVVLPFAIAVDTGTCGASPFQTNTPSQSGETGRGLQETGNGLKRPEGLAPRLRDLQAAGVVFRSAIDSVRPALVTIESFGGVSAIPGVIGGIRRQGEGNTTGVMLSPDGWIVTSTFNFVQRPNAITVITSDGERRLAKMYGQDNTRKICLLRVDGRDDFPCAKLADSGDVFVGQWSLAMGVGFGDSNPSVSAGIVSALGRIGGRAIQTNAKTSPACYGGPLIDVHGRVLGICVPMNPESWSATAGVEWYDSGIGFAIPLAGSEMLLEKLRNSEIINPAFLGVSVTPAKAGGVEVADVVAGSPAAKLGLVPGTRLVRLGTQPVDTPAGFRRMLMAFTAGESVELEFVLAGAEQHSTGTVTLSVIPELAKQGQRPPGL